jgi:ligand-binding sensor domain-containing protein
MRIFHVLFYFVLFFFITTLSAQKFIQAIGQHHFEVYTPQEGLAQSNVVRIFQDSRGYLWFGTSRGVSRFDGINFHNLTEKDGLSNNLVNGITEDKHGNLIFGTRSGICVYDGKNFTTYTKKDGLPHNFIWTVVADDDGSIWVGTGNGVAKFYPDRLENKFEIILPNAEQSKNESRCIYKDRNNVWWIGTREEVYKCYNKNLIPIQSPQKDVHSLVMDNNNYLYIGGWMGLSIYDGKNFIFNLSSSKTGSGGFTSLVCSSKGNIWAGTWEGGIYQISIKKNQHPDSIHFLQYTIKNGLPHNSVWSLLEDREGNLWVGMFGGGVCMYSSNLFTCFNEKYGLANEIINSIMKDNEGIIWFTSENGITKYNPNDFNNKRYGLEPILSINNEPVNKIMGMAINKINGDKLFLYYGGFGDGEGYIYRK